MKEDIKGNIVPMRRREDITLLRREYCIEEEKSSHEKKKMKEQSIEGERDKLQYSSVHTVVRTMAIID